MTALELAPDGHPTLDQLGYSWLAGIHAKRTREAYGRDLRDWLRFCERIGVHPLDVGRTEVDAWVLAQLSADAAPASVTRRLVAVRGWYDHLVHDLDVIPKNPAVRVQAPKVHRTQRAPIISVEQAATMARLAADDGPVFELAYRLMLCNGLRLEEVTDGLRTTAVRKAPNGELYAEVIGKGQKPRLAVFTGRTAALVHAAVWPPMARHTELETMQNRRVVPLPRSTLQRHVAKWGRKAGVSGRVYPHALRIAFGSMLQGDVGAAAGVKLEWVQDALGHTDPRTTRGYDTGRNSMEHAPSRVIEQAIEEGS